MSDNSAYCGPETYALADWRRRVSVLYGAIRDAASPRKGWQIWRDGRDDLFRNHPQSPLPQNRRRTFAGLPLFEYDEEFLFTVGLNAAEQPEAVELHLGADGAVRMRATAQTSGLAEKLGGELTLFWIDGYGGGLFLPFADASSGIETYGGGRYLIDTIKGVDLGLHQDGRIILDFNFAYNPSCSYSPEFICPLAPMENRLNIAIPVGERLDQPIASIDDVEE